MGIIEEAQRRYSSDPHWKQLVDAMVNMLDPREFSADDVKLAATFAVYRHQQQERERRA